MQLAELRARVAPLFHMTEDNLRVRQQALYREPALRKLGMTGRGTELRDRALTATAASSALLVLTAMLGKTRETIGPAVVQLWEARCVTPAGNPLERCKTLGALLTLLLQRADVRSRLIYFEIDHDIPHASFVFGRDQKILDERLPPDQWQHRIDRAVAAGEVARIFYAPFRPDAWRRRVDTAFVAGEMAHINRLPSSTLDKVAAMLADQGTA